MEHRNLLRGPLLIDRMAGNEDIFSRLVADGEFRRLAVEHLLGKVYAQLKKVSGS